MTTVSTVGTDEELGLEPVPMIEQPQRGNLGCRVVKDYSQVVGFLGSVGGTFTAGIGYGKEDLLITLIGGVVVVAVVVFLSVRISCLKPEKELENQVAALNDTVRVLQGNETVLTQQCENLQLELADVKESIASLGDVLKVPLDDMEHIVDQIGKIEEKMRVLIDLYHRYKNTAEVLREEIGKFKETNQVSEIGLNHFKRDLKSLDVVEDELSEEVDEYLDASTFQQHQNEQLQGILETIGEDFTVIEGCFKNMQTELEELREYVNQLDEADDKYRDGAADFHAGVQDIKDRVLPEIERLQEDLLDAINDLNSLTGSESDEIAKLLNDYTESTSKSDS